MILNKVVGKATAFLYVLLGVKEIYAEVISAPATDGICPFESAVIDIDDAETAYDIIRRRIASMG